MFIEIAEKDKQVLLAKLDELFPKQDYGEQDRIDLHTLLFYAHLLKLEVDKKKITQLDDEHFFAIKELYDVRSSVVGVDKEEQIAHYELIADYLCCYNYKLLVALINGVDLPEEIENKFLLASADFYYKALWSFSVGHGEEDRYERLLLKLIMICIFAFRNKSDAINGKLRENIRKLLIQTGHNLLLIIFKELYDPITAPNQLEKIFRPSLSDKLSVLKARVASIVEISKLYYGDFSRLDLEGWPCVFLPKPNTIVAIKLAWRTLVHNFVFSEAIVTYYLDHDNSITTRALAVLREYYAECYLQIYSMICKWAENPKEETNIDDIKKDFLAKTETMPGRVVGKYCAYHPSTSIYLERTLSGADFDTYKSGLFKAAVDYAKDEKWKRFYSLDTIVRDEFKKWQNSIACHYREGQYGFKKDQELARAWLNVANSKKYERLAEALFTLAKYYIFGVVSKDEVGDDAADGVEEQKAIKDIEPRDAYLITECILQFLMSNVLKEELRSENFALKARLLYGYTHLQIELYDRGYGIPARYVDGVSYGSELIFSVLANVKSKEVMIEGILEKETSIYDLGLKFVSSFFSELAKKIDAYVKYQDVLKSKQKGVFAKEDWAKFISSFVNSDICASVDNPKKYYNCLNIFAGNLKLLIADIDDKTSLECLSRIAGMFKLPSYSNIFTFAWFAYLRKILSLNDKDEAAGEPIERLLKCSLRSQPKLLYGFDLHQTLEILSLAKNVTVSKSEIFVMFLRKIFDFIDSSKEIANSASHTIDRDQTIDVKASLQEKRQLFGLLYAIFNADHDLSQMVAGELEIDGVVVDKDLFKRVLAFINDNELSWCAMYMAFALLNNSSEWLSKIRIRFDADINMLEQFFISPNYDHNTRILGLKKNALEIDEIVEAFLLVTSQFSELFAFAQEVFSRIYDVSKIIGSVKTFLQAPESQSGVLSLFFDKVQEKYLLNDDAPFAIINTQMASLIGEAKLKLSLCQAKQINLLILRDGAVTEDQLLTILRRGPARKNDKFEDNVNSSMDKIHEENKQIAKSFYMVLACANQDTDGERGKKKDKKKELNSLRRAAMDLQKSIEKDFLVIDSIHPLFFHVILSILQKAKSVCDIIVKKANLTESMRDFADVSVKKLIHWLSLMYKAERATFGGDREYYKFLSYYAEKVTERGGDLKDAIEYTILHENAYFAYNLLKNAHQKLYNRFLELQKKCLFLQDVKGKNFRFDLLDFDKKHLGNKECNSPYILIAIPYEKKLPQWSRSSLLQWKHKRNQGKFIFFRRAKINEKNSYPVFQIPLYGNPYEDKNTRYNLAYAALQLSLLFGIRDDLQVIRYHNTPARCSAGEEIFYKVYNAVSFVFSDVKILSGSWQHLLKNGDADIGVRLARKIATKLIPATPLVKEVQDGNDDESLSLAKFGNGRGR